MSQGRSKSKFRKRKSEINKTSNSSTTTSKPKIDRRNNSRNSGKRKSNINPKLLVKKASPTIETEYISERSFADMPIHENLKETIERKGFTKPTEIQDKTLEPLLEGQDLLGIAQTGTGKTGAFLIPIIDQLIGNRKKPYALVVAPTRELAVQIEDEFKSLTKDLKIFSQCFIGGTNINRDQMLLKRQAHIIIATPGRLLDLVKRRALDLRPVHTLVLDEFDRMLDMGFVHDVKNIIALLRNRQQTLLFSATVDKTQQKLIEDILYKPVSVKVSSGEGSSDNVDQDVIKVKPNEDKFKILCELLNQEETGKTLVFEESKHRASRLSKKLNKVGIDAGEIHGDRSQNQRQRALNQFKKGEIQVLVATDVAARGIDVLDVTHVINYQLPLTYDSYIHRIGRTGRAGKTGKAFTFVESN